MVQLEAGQRLTTTDPGGSDYRAMNVRCQRYATFSSLFDIPRTAFYPPPNVDSSLLHFALRRTNDWADTGRPTEKAFWSFVNLAFSSRRKMVRNNLKGLYDVEKVEEVLVERRKAATARPQELTYDDFVVLSRALAGEEGSGNKAKK
jgi:16S rRNA (adenine1518-N6/adenine1519-N6)-dimethyltransferase